MGLFRWFLYEEHEPWWRSCLMMAIAFVIGLVFIAIAAVIWYYTVGELE